MDSMSWDYLRGLLTLSLYPHETAWISCGYFEDGRFSRFSQILEQVLVIGFANGHRLTIRLSLSKLYAYTPMNDPPHEPWNPKIPWLMCKIIKIALGPPKAALLG